MRKIALITGGATGIGAVVARKAAASGYDVAIADIDEDNGTQLASELGIRFFKCDFAEEAEILKLTKTVGPVWLLVNGVGVLGPVAPLTKISTAEWKKSFDVNITSHFITTREILPEMLKNKSGCIINFSSAAAKVGYRDRSPYVSSKKAVLGLTAALAREVGTEGVRVNAIIPGIVKGERLYRSVEKYAELRSITQDEALQHMVSRMATARLIEPEEIADTVLFLASDSARSITGQFIAVDGGFE
ncbi:SDR family oxidoreductase [Inquilinus limosus]|uniref:SDR family NAD(P)-dependent oxidoreductase n=1 Tax=Inquilinus limosus TaxID=171674 RepID=UPI003F142CDD